MLWGEERGFGVGHSEPDGGGCWRWRRAGDQQRPAAAMLFLQTRAPVLWRSPAATRYKQVLRAGNEMRAKKTIWTWGGVWAALELGRGWGLPSPSVPPLSPFK